MKRDKLSIKFYQPSWVQLIIHDKVIYIDPAYLKKYYVKYPNKIDFTTWPDPIDGLPDKDLPKADIILITHHHKDHCKDVTVNRLKKENTTIIAPHRCIKELGTDIEITQPGNIHRIGKIGIAAVLAYNTPEGSSTKKNHKKGQCVGYIIEIGKLRIYHAGDTDLIPEMNKLGMVNIAFLPIGGKFTMNIAEAIEAAKLIQPELVIPMHNMNADMVQFEREASHEGVNVKILEIGEMLEVEL